MDKDKFNETLFHSRTRTYCVLDGAAVPGLPKRLYDFETPNYPLIRGELAPDMVHVVPYLAIMIRNNPFSDWVIDESFGKNWGIFVHSRFSITEMRKHFRALMTVHDETGRPLLFRFYDPRVFRKFLPSCDEEQVTGFFGKVDAFYVESGENDSLIAYTHENGQLDQKEIELSTKD